MTKRLGIAEVSQRENNVKINRSDFLSQSLDSLVDLASLTGEFAEHLLPIQSRHSGSHCDHPAPLRRPERAHHTPFCFSQVASFLAPLSDVLALSHS